MKDIKIKFNQMIKLSKFTFNKKILNKITTYATTKFIFKFYCQILSYYLWTYLMVKEAQQVSGVAHFIDCRRKPMQ